MSLLCLGIILNKIKQNIRTPFFSPLQVLSLSYTSVLQGEGVAYWYTLLLNEVTSWFYIDNDAAVRGTHPLPDSMLDCCCCCCFVVVGVVFCCLPQGDTIDYFFFQLKKCQRLHIMTKAQSLPTTQTAFR